MDKNVNQVFDVTFGTCFESIFESISRTLTFKKHYHIIGVTPKNTSLTNKQSTIIDTI